MTLGRLKPWIPHFVALVMVALGAWYVVGHRDDFARLGRVDPAQLALVALAFTASCAVGGYLLNLFLRRYGVRLPWYRWFGLYVFMTVGNFVTPVRGGTGLCAAYLKSEHGLNLRRFGMVLLGTYVLSAMMNATLALAGVGLVYLRQGWADPTILIVSASILLVCAATFFMPNLRESERPVWKYVVRLVNGWHELFHDRSLLWKALLLTLAQTLVQTGMHLLVYRSLDIAISPEAAVGFAVMMTIVALSIIAAMMSVTPGSLGPYDAALVAVPTVFGLTVQQTASALIVFRGTTFVTAFFLAGVFWLVIRLARKPAPPDAVGR